MTGQTKEQTQGGWPQSQPPQKKRESKLMNQATKMNTGAAGRIRGVVLGLVFFAAGAALSAWWFLQTPLRSPTATDESGPPALTAATVAVLQHLSSSVEIRFYSLLDPVSAGDSGRQFSGRVDQLLSRYEQEAGGKIKIIKRVNSISPASANAAVADGIQAFNMDQGDACYLGLVAVCNGQKVPLASLAPECGAGPGVGSSAASSPVVDHPAPRPTGAPKADAASLAAVKQAIPNLDAMSVEEGSQTLRAASRAQFEKTGQEMQEKVGTSGGAISPGANSRL